MRGTVSLHNDDLSLMLSKHFGMKVNVSCFYCDDTGGITIEYKVVINEIYMDEE